jgi:hypothetical protein
MKYKARLCGIKPLDCAAANKFVHVWNELNDIEKDFNGEGKNPCIRNMAYDGNEEFTDEWAESIYLVSFVDENGAIHNYLCFHNSYDGYRSHANVIKMPNTDRSLCSNLEHLYLKVSIVENETEETGMDEYGEMDRTQNVFVINYRNSALFVCKTEHVNDYYPYGLIRYNCEKLPSGRK